MRHSREVAEALKQGRPIVALESTIIAHGLPYPGNLECAQLLETTVRQAGAVPATIALLGGQIHVGLEPDELARLADPNAKVLKLSTHDIPLAMARKADGATTVAATLAIAERAGIEIFATGGIGGVHRDVAEAFDISADIRALSTSKLTVVSAGAKSILDLPKTLEALESAQVLVVGYQTDRFPAFYTRGTLPLTHSVADAEELARVHNARRDWGSDSALLVANPIPEAHALNGDQEEALIAEAIQAAKASSVAGKQLTPFLLAHLHQASQGTTQRANIELIRNNTALAAELAVVAHRLRGE